jgi:hypothetical protein
VDTITASEQRYAPTLVTGEVRGCLITLLATPIPGATLSHMIVLDRVPGTYSRSLTPVELAALARLNPDDGVPDDALRVLCDLGLAVATLTGEWEAGRPLRQDGQPSYQMAALFRPLLGDELSELGRVASQLLTAVRPC